VQFIDLSKFPPETRKYISELLKRNAIGSDSLDDQAFINYLSTQKYDEDFIISMIKDRNYPNI
jgi:hypothetical protein